MHPDKLTKKSDSTWTTEELKSIYDLRHKQHFTWKKIATKIKTKTATSIKKKDRRTDWNEFLKDPDAYDRGVSFRRKWSFEEMIQLDAYLQAGQSYDFIAEKLGRSISSVESQAQKTDWKAWKKIKEVSPDGKIESISQDQQESLLDQLIGALLTICRYEFNRLENIKEKDFLVKVNLEKLPIPMSFNDLRAKAREELVILGFGNPETKDLSPGTYVIVGDSHGKHTKKEMFDLIDSVNRFLKPKNIIHIGHILDDDNDISWDWERYNNLLILAKVEELRIVQSQRNKFKFNYDVVRDNLSIGDLVINNQDLITDYVKTSIATLDNQIFDDKVIVNCHRLEFSTRCCNGGVSYFASPGCICENHPIRTVRQINFEDGNVVKQACHDGFIKYRRMKYTNKYWERGLLVVQMDKKKNVTIVPCVIKQTPKGPAISYFDKMITANGVFNPDKKIFVNGDLHCDMHDVNILDIQEQICKDYKPDIHVNVGDTFNYSSLNHHILDRGGVILDKKILDEAAQVNYVLGRCKKWARESYLIYGNHERFAKDFVEKYPQFGQYLDFRFICNLDGLGYKLTQLKDVLKIGSTKFIHGEIKFFGQQGNKMEKTSRTMGKDCFIGHIHRPEIRFGCYSIGLSADLNQSYNETAASNWLHGFGLCNQFMGQSWPTSIAIVDYKCILNGHTYSPLNLESWKMNKYKAHIDYRF